MKNNKPIIIGVASAIVAAAIITTAIIVNNNHGNNTNSPSNIISPTNNTSAIWSDGGVSIKSIEMNFVGTNSCNIVMVLANNTDKDYELNMKKFEFKLDNGYTFQIPSSTWTLSANHSYINHGANFDDDVVEKLKAGDTVHISYDGKELTTITIKGES